MRISLIARRRRRRLAWVFMGLILPGVFGSFLYFLAHRPPAETPVVVRSPLPAKVPHFSSEVCRRTYERVFRRPDLEVRVVFGYKDSRPTRFVADRYERLLFINRILAPCRDALADCGFHREPSDPELFLKEIIGPDGSPRRIAMRVLSSSVGADDEENRANPFQAWSSKRAQKIYLDGISEADIVLYNGHSRAGGGPDFQPPHLRKNQEVDFGWYQKKRPGIEPVFRRLAEKNDRLKMLGFLSCASSRHFLSRVNQLRPQLATLTSARLIYFSDALESSLETLASIFSFQCEPEFEASLKKTKTRAGGARVLHWFF